MNKDFFNASFIMKNLLLEQDEIKERTERQLCLFHE